MHTLRRLGAPLTRARTRWMLGFHRRLVRTWECETLLPKMGPLPQTSHTAATVSLLIFNASTLRPMPGVRSYRPRRGALGNPNTIADLCAGPQAALACVPAHAALLDTRGLSVRQTGSVLYLTMQGVCAPGGCGGNGLTSAPVARMLHRFSGALSKVPVRAPRSGGRNVSRQVL